MTLKANKKEPTAPTVDRIQNNSPSVYHQFRREAMYLIVCSVPNCIKQVRARGMCMGHYRRVLRNGTIELKRIKTQTVETIPPRLCSVVGCDRQHYGNGYCIPHLQRFNNTGDAGSAEIRLLQKQIGNCIHDGCEKKSVSNSYCYTHYVRFKKYGSSTITNKRGRPRKEQS